MLGKSLFDSNSKPNSETDLDTPNSMTSTRMAEMSQNEDSQKSDVLTKSRPAFLVWNLDNAGKSVCSGTGLPEQS